MYINDINPTDKEGNTVLHQAASAFFPTKQSTKTFKFLMKHYEDINPKNLSDETPLHIAADRGNFEICKLIINRISNKNPIDDIGDTTVCKFVSTLVFL